MGVVIGKGGESIQRIRDEFHVTIYTVSSAYTELIDLERVLYVIGDEANVCHCVRHILLKLEPNDLARREPVSVAVYQQMTMRPLVQSAQLYRSFPTTSYMYDPFYQQWMQTIVTQPQLTSSYSVQPSPPSLGYSYVDGSPAAGRLVIALPSDRCGNVLGRGGAVMNFIKASSSCKISLQRREDMVPGTQYRMVTVLGSEEGIKRAVYVREGNHM